MKVSDTLTLGQHLTGKGRLEEFELRQAQAGEAAVVGVFDLAVLAKGRAQQAHRADSLGLDFEVDGPRGLQAGYTMG
jgi:hypothetical protein